MEMRGSTEAERTALADEIAELARDTITEWARRWQSVDGLAHLRLVHQTDGTAILEVDDEPVMRVGFEVSISVAEYVQAVEPSAVNEPTGFVLSRAWEEVPAGWFVQGPKQAWYEVLATRKRDNRQHVTLLVNGKRGTWPRDPAAKVSARRGTLANAEVGMALDVFQQAGLNVTIVDDAS